MSDDDIRKATDFQEHFLKHYYSFMIGVATPDDYHYLLEHDHHISEAMLRRKLEAGEILIAKDHETAIGYLRYGYF